MAVPNKVFAFCSRLFVRSLAEEAAVRANSTRKFSYEAGAESRVDRVKLFPSSA